MNTFFKSTDIAIKALRKETAVRPYYSGGFHRDNFFNGLAHSIRIYSNVLMGIFKLLIWPIDSMNREAWRESSLNVLSSIDNFAAAIVSLVALAIAPFMFFVRTMCSFVLGYDKTNREDAVNDRATSFAII